MALQGYTDQPCPQWDSTPHPRPVHVLAMDDTRQQVP